MRFTAVGMTTLGDLEAWEIAHETAARQALGPVTFTMLGGNDPLAWWVVDGTGQRIAGIDRGNTRIGLRAVCVKRICTTGNPMCETCGRVLRKIIGDAFAAEVEAGRIPR